MNKKSVYEIQLNYITESRELEASEKFNMLREMRISLEDEEKASQKQANYKYLISLVLGLLLATLSISLAFKPSPALSDQQRNVSAFLAGMFGFTSVEILRRRR